MIIIKKVFALLFLGCFMLNTAIADLWQDTSLRGASTIQAKQNQVFRFDEARLLNLDMNVLDNHLSTALPEGSIASPVTIQLPLPHGEFVDYLLYQSPVMAPELAAFYPGIRTFKVVAVDNSAFTGRLDLTIHGFHAMLHRNNQIVYIDPIGNSNHYQSYYKRDYSARRVNSANHKAFVCRNGDHNNAEPLLADLLLGTSKKPMRATRLSFGNQIKTYRLAIAATGEFTQFHGGTNEKGMAALVTGINRINEVYERDLAVKLEIVANNNKIVYTDANTDPFIPFFSLADQAPLVINSVIGSANYDVGHVVSGAGNGGLAGINVICNDARKASGESSSTTPINDPFFIDFVAHELGHQFGSHHSFNGLSGSCDFGNRTSQHAYEPGSGSTIMAYAGICPLENLQTNTDAYFHSDSIEQIRAHLDNGSGNGCGVISGSNGLPTVSAGSDGVIPQQTPFSLTGSGSDPNGDTLTYTWEQIDLGPATNSRNLVDTGSGPIFRSFTPTASPTRTFPQLNDVLNGTTTYGEVMPSTDRDLNLRLTVRDGKGGVVSAETKVQVVTASGPFTVTVPANSNWADSRQAITWNVANTTAAPVSCATVKIDLSTNGGNSFPTTLLASTANDGMANVTIPALTTNTGRVRVSCTSQPFFAINSSNISISSDGSGGNTTPIALNDSYTFTQSGNTRQLNVLQNDSDADGDTLIITNVSSSGNHSITVASDGKSISFKHSSGFSGTVNFTYTISDGTAQVNANVSITVTAVNNAPIATNDSYTFTQSDITQQLNVLQNDSDVDGDTLTITNVSSSGNHSITVASDGKSINFKHSSGFSGTVNFIYTISDGTAQANANVSVVITAPVRENQVPIANTDRYEVEQNSSATTLNLLENDTDADGDELTIIRINSISGGGTVIVAADGKSVSYTPARGFTGTEVINYAIRDENGDTGSTNTKITVKASSTDGDSGDGGGGSSTPYFLLALLLLVVIRSCKFQYSPTAQKGT